MHVCPNCGYNNPDASETCLSCNRVLPPPAVPQEPLQLPAAQAQTSRQKTLQYFLGLGMGLIPLLLFFLGLGLSAQPGSSTSPLLAASFLLYLAAIIATITCLTLPNVRFVGYGLLTIVLASPVIGAVGCFVIVASSLHNIR